MPPYLQGSLLGLLAAICYGFIPTFTVPVLAEGLNTPSILFYRFGFAAAMLALLMLIRRKSFRVSRGELVSLLYVALISDASALFLIEGYQYMSTGVATTLHFMYPVVTALIMIIFYNEARRVSTFAAILMAVGGVAVLSYQSSGNTDWKGVTIVLLSAVWYALYIIRVNRSRLQGMEITKLTFYIMFIGSLLFAADAFCFHSLETIPTPKAGVNLLLLAFVCTMVTNLSIVGAVKRIGSTMTSVLGACEPLVAVLMGCLFMHEPFTLRIFIGVVLIIPAAIIVIFTRGRSKTAARSSETVADSSEKAGHSA